MVNHLNTVKSINLKDKWKKQKRLRLNQLQYYQR